MQKYFLTYDFRMIYNTTAILKEFDPSTGSFKTLDVYLDLDRKAYEIPFNYVEIIINTLYKEPIAFELSEEKMNWIQKFEDKLNHDSKILRNRSLVFNYLILKLLLCGLPEKIAKEFIINYYASPDVEVQILEMIQKINGFIDRKKYWIMNNTSRDRNVLRNFIINILKTKLRNPSKFSFEEFRAEDNELCPVLILPKLIEFNSTTSYLIKTPLTLTEQKSYLLAVYEMFIRDIIETVIKQDLRYHFEPYFIDAIVSEMVSDANSYLNIREISPDYFQKKPL